MKRRNLRIASFRCGDLNRGFESLETRLLMAYDLEMVVDINQQLTSYLDPQDFTRGSRPKELVEVEDGFYLLAYDGVTGHGYQLWNAQFAEDSDQLDFRLVPTDLFSKDHTAKIGEQVLVFADRSGEIWKSDDEGASFSVVTSIGERGFFHRFTEVSDHLFFRYHGLWVTDGTESGTRSIQGLSEHSVQEVHRLNDTSAIVMTQRREFEKGQGYFLWRVDVDSDQAVLVAEDLGNTHGRRDRPQDFTERNGILYFGLASGLWRTDGTPQGTSLLKAGDSVRSIVNVDGTLFFSNRHTLWTSDGTADGTMSLRNDVYLGGESGGDRPTFNFNGVLAFRAEQLVRGMKPRDRSGDELWLSDGTAEGTRMMKEIVPGPMDSDVRQVTVIGDRLYFTTEDERRLWVTDGTAEGTRELADLSGSRPKRIERLTAIHDRIFFVGEDGVHGEELWTVREVLDGDIDLNGRVDFSDFVILSQHYGKVERAAWLQGDVNDDDMIDFKDFEVLQRQFGKSLVETE